MPAPDVISEAFMTPAEVCRCGHGRDQHTDGVNPLEVVPLSMTEADQEERPRGLSTNVHGIGGCTVEGCKCRQYAAREE